MVTPPARHLGALNHIPSHFWPVLIIVVLSCCATVPKSQTTGNSDASLGRAVELALAADDRLSGANITVTVTDAIVDLSGTVGNADQVRRALRRAGDVEGVRGIVNRLRVVGQEPAPVGGQNPFMY